MMDNKKLIEETREYLVHRKKFHGPFDPAMPLLLDLTDALEKAEAEKRELYQMGTVEKCKRFHTQNCHECPDPDCCDNTSPAMKRIRELEDEIQRVRADDGCEHEDYDVC